MMVLAASFVTKIQEWAYQWSSVVMILFFAALLYLMWRTLKVMPRVKPQQIKPVLGSVGRLEGHRRRR